MIQGTYYKEWSRMLGRDMEFKVYGHAGTPVLALPARGGRFYDWENNGMPDAIAPLLNEGKVQLFCADAMDGEGLLNGDLPQRRRAELECLALTFAWAGWPGRSAGRWATGPAEAGRHAATAWSVRIYDPSVRLAQPGRPALDRSTSLAR